MIEDTPGASRPTPSLGALHGRSLCRIARCVGPRERRASPFLDVDSEVLLVPSSQCDRVVRVEEDSSDTCDSLHLNLRSETKLERTAFATPNVALETAGRMRLLRAMSAR